jgi:hypothetical protein
MIVPYTTQAVIATEPNQHESKRNVIKTLLYTIFAGESHEDSIRRKIGRIVGSKSTTLTNQYSIDFIKDFIKHLCSEKWSPYHYSLGRIMSHQMSKFVTKEDLLQIYLTDHEVLEPFVYPFMEDCHEDMILPLTQKISDLLHSILSGLLFIKLPNRLDMTEILIAKAKNIHLEYQK